MIFILLSNYNNYLITVQLVVYDRGLSFFSLYKARSDTLATFTTYKTNKDT